MAYFIYSGGTLADYLELHVPAPDISAFSIESTFAGGFEKIEDCLDYVAGYAKSLVTVNLPWDGVVIAVCIQSAPQSTIPWSKATEDGLFFQKVTGFYRS